MKKLALVLIASAVLTAACGSPSTQPTQTAATAPSSTTTGPAESAVAASPDTTSTAPADEATSTTAAVAGSTTTKPKAKGTTTTTALPGDTTPSTDAPDTSTTTSVVPSGPASTTTTAKPASTTTTRPPTTTTTFTYSGPQFRCNTTSKSGWECRGTTLKGDGGYWACWPDMGWQCAGETGNGFGTWSWSQISDTEWQGGGDTAMGRRVWVCKWNGSSSFKYWSCRQLDESGTYVDGDNGTWMWAPGINSYKVEYKTSSDVSCWDNNGWYCTMPKVAISTHIQMPVPFPLVAFCPGKYTLPPPGWQGNPCG